MTRLRDHVVMVDGPLKGRTFTVNGTLMLGDHMHVQVAIDRVTREVIAVEGDQWPGVETAVSKSYKYEPVLAEDGHISRGDDGHVAVRFAGEGC